VLGVVAAALVLVGRFALASDVFAYTGSALLVAASVWNAWPVGRSGNRACPSSAPESPPEIR